MPAYALAHLRSIQMGPEIAEYLKKIDATLPPFGGRFIVHGAQVEVVEGEWPGHLVIIEFPDREHARDWYESPAYQEILPLRTEHSDSVTLIVDGVGPDYRAAKLVA
jgi:uncharacterized protein (DUF1330 family)